jgi:DNA-binding transcriptional ArsR family regulator
MGDWERGERGTFDLDEVFLGLGHPVRREMIRFLMAGPLYESDLYRRFPLARNSVNKHVRILLRAGLIHRGHETAPRLLTADPARLDRLAGWLAGQRALWTAPAPTRTAGTRRRTARR